MPASGSGSPNYLVYSPIFLNARKTSLSGYGAMLQCFTRAACLINGNYLGSSGLFNGIEGLFGNKSGSEKKDAAMSFLENALATVDAVAAREIVEPEKFRSGISKIIDGTVECLNATTWAKSGAQASSAAPQS